MHVENFKLDSGSWAVLSFFALFLSILASSARFRRSSPADDSPFYYVFRLDLDSNQKEAIARARDVKNEVDAPAILKLQQLWREELDDHPELIPCGMQSGTHPVPKSLKSRNRRVELMRVQAYAAMSKYISPEKLDSEPNSEKPLSYFRAQEKPLIAVLEKSKKDAWRTIKSILTYEQLRILDGLRHPRPYRIVPQRSPSALSQKDIQERRAQNIYERRMRVDIESLTPVNVYLGVYLTKHGSRFESEWKQLNKQSPIEVGQDQKSAVVNFEVDIAGTISNAKIISSSGIKELDDQIMNVIEKQKDKQFSLPLGSIEIMRFQLTFTCNLSATTSIGEVSIVRPESQYDYSAYISDLKKQIYEMWFPLKRGCDSRDTTITFDVYKDGKTANPTVSDSSGELELDQSAMNAFYNIGQLPTWQGICNQISVEATFHLDATTGAHSLGTIITGPHISQEPDRSELNSYVLELQQKLEANWVIPTNAGQKPRRTVIRLNLFTRDGVGGEYYFSCGNKEADKVAADALHLSALMLPRPTGMPGQSNIEVTFNYHLPKKQ